MNNLNEDDLKRMELMGDRLLVIEQEPLLTESNIQLLSNDHKWDRYGTVVKTGPGYEHVGMPVKAGQKVAIGKEAGTPICFDLPDEERGGIKEVTLLMIRLNAVMAVIEDDAVAEG